MDITPFLPMLTALGPWGLVAATVIGAIYTWRRGGKPSPVPMIPVVPGGPQKPVLPVIPGGADRPILDAILKLLRDAAARRPLADVVELASPVSDGLPLEPIAVHPDNFTAWTTADLMENQYAMGVEIDKRKEKLKAEWIAMTGW